LTRIGIHVGLEEALVTALGWKSRHEINDFVDGCSAFMRRTLVPAVFGDRHFARVTTDLSVLSLNMMESEDVRLPDPGDQLNIAVYV